jgi:hypothetical protein
MESMTKRLTATLLCVAAALALVGTATAEAKGLSIRTATDLARQLARKQVSGRHVVSYHLRKGRRVSATRIKFAYDDRSREGVFCTAVVIVEQTVRGRTTTLTARFAEQRCNGIPREVLQFEAITRQAQRAVRKHTAATARGLIRVGEAVYRCRKVRVPRAREANAVDLFDIAMVEALEQPSDAVVGDFATKLLDVNASDRTLDAGATGWADWVAIVRSLPQIDDPCAELKSWARDGFALNKAPIDFAAYRRLDARAGADVAAIERAAALMARKGAFPNVVVGFTPEGLLQQLMARRGVTSAMAARAKVVLR